MDKYVALLRGINISGKNKVPMKELKDEFEHLGYKDVTTYLNSGNVIFTSSIDDKIAMSENIHKMVKDKFCVNVPVYIIKSGELKELLDNQPDWWGTDNKKIYDNIIFIISPYTYEDVYKTIGEPKEGLEKVVGYKNCIFWSYDLKNYRKTNWWAKTASTSISDFITIRTANTMRKILEICNK